MPVASFLPSLTKLDAPTSIGPSLLRGTAILLLYAAVFTALRSFAGEWAQSYFSLWFPAAGWRFAFLWRFGPRIAPAAAAAELLVQLAMGQNHLDPSPLLSLLGIVGPCLVYGVVIQFAQARIDSRAILRFAPLPFSIAALLGPVLACLAALPWAIPRALASGSLDAASLFTSLLVFAMGDMLGILIVAPPVLWVSHRLRRTSVSGQFSLPSSRLMAEMALVTLGAWSLVWGIARAGFGVMLAPILLATCWTGLRTGRVGAWATILIAAIIVLPITASANSPALQLSLHVLLACIAAIGFLSGSFADAERRFHAEIARRDRLLYQAERLKTLRAMSVAVIHEISQPLSTIAIEAKGMAEATTAPDIPIEIRETSRLIARKARDLSQMVRRLRGFGDRNADDPSPIPVSLLLAEIEAIAAPEANRSSISLEVDKQSDAVVLGQDIELRQAMLNLVRNAVAATPGGGTVSIGHDVVGDWATLWVENELTDPGSRRHGMGIGLIIARSIAQAHGGDINENRDTPNRISFGLRLPIHGDANDRPQ